MDATPRVPCGRSTASDTFKRFFGGVANVSPNRRGPIPLWAGTSEQRSESQRVNLNEIMGLFFNFKAPLCEVGRVQSALLFQLDP
jgi:hypothetical protein